jgi:acetylglutamate kinase
LWEQTLGERRTLLQEAIQKADTLLEALGWIRRFRDKITVIKLGGSVMETEDALRHVLLDIVFMSTVGMRPVVVHGAGAAISRAMDAAGLQPRFIQGRRYTDEATLAIVEQVLAYDINEQLTLQDRDGQPLDLGHVGNVTQVDRTVIENLCYAGQVPIIPSMCLDESGGKLNVNADTAATAVAQAVRAEKLVFLSDVNGVRRDKSDPHSLIHSLTASEARRLMTEGSIESGMIPKVEACLETLEQGVSKIHIIDGRLRHSLLLEIYTTEGVGTQIIRDDAAEVPPRTSTAAAGR